MNIWKNRNWTPMLLGEEFKPFNSKKFLYEIKFDGVRALIFVSPSEFMIKNRKNQDITHLYPELEKIKKLVNKETIFDGEITCFENKSPSFSKLQERSHLKDKTKIKYHSKYNPVIFMCFDILYYGNNLIDKSLLERKSILNQFKENDVFSKVYFIENDGIKLFNKIKKLNLEGIVAKLKQSPYSINKRVKDWLKIKNWKEDVFYIGGYKEKEKNYVFSIFLGEYKNKNFYYVGNVVVSKKDKLYKKILKLKTTSSCFINFNEQGNNYIKPTIKCCVEYLERTKNNSLRQPIYKKNLK